MVPCCHCFEWDVEKFETKDVDSRNPEWIRGLK